MRRARVGYRVVALVACLGAPAGGLAQDPWPNARCYALTFGRWGVEGDSTSGQLGPVPPVPDLLILEDAAVDSFIWSRSTDLADTSRHVVHSRSRDSRWSDGGFDPSMIYWHRPTPDALAVVFSTGYGGLTFGFRPAEDGVRGSVGTFSDVPGAPSWVAPVAGVRTRCPAPPPRLGVLRLTLGDIADTARTAGPRLQLTTEKRFDCGGQFISYEAIVSPDTIAVRTIGAYPPPAGCRDAPGPAATTLDGPRRRGRTTLLIQHEGEVNVFVLSATSSSLTVTPERARTVVGADAVSPRAGNPPR